MAILACVLLTELEGDIDVAVRARRIDVVKMVGEDENARGLRAKQSE